MGWTATAVMGAATVAFIVATVGNLPGEAPEIYGAHSRRLRIRAEDLRISAFRTFLK